MRVEQALQRGLAHILGHPFRQVRNGDPDVGRVFGLADLEISGFPAADVDRLLPVNDRHLARKTAHQMLRPLEHEVPPQVRKADQGWGFGIRRRGLGFRLHRHPDARQHFSFILRAIVAHRMNGQWGIPVPQRHSKLTQICQCCTAAFARAGD